MAQITLNVAIHEEDDGSYWAEVEELAGCFASGFSMEELKDATIEAIQLWLPDGIELENPRWGPAKEKRKKSSSNGKSGNRKRPRRMLVCA